MTYSSSWLGSLTIMAKRIKSYPTWMMTGKKKKKLMQKNSHFFLSFFFFYFLRQESHHVTQAGEQYATSAHHNLCLPCSSDSPPSASWAAGTTGACHTQLIFVFLVETGFHHIGQAGLEFLTLWSTCLGLLKCWDYRHEPSCPGFYSLLSTCYTFHFVSPPCCLVCPAHATSMDKALPILQSLMQAHSLSGTWTLQSNRKSSFLSWDNCRTQEKSKQIFLLLFILRK